MTATPWPLHAHGQPGASRVPEKIGTCGLARARYLPSFRDGSRLHGDIMNANRPEKKSPDREAKDDVSRRSPEETEGEAAATEEDIGTEGAGTESRATSDKRGDAAPAPRDKN